MGGGSLSILICSLYGPGEEAVCQPAGVGPVASPRGHQIKQGVCRVALALLRQQDVAMCSRLVRRQPMIFWAVFMTLCTAFLSSAVEPAYHTSRQYAFHRVIEG